MTNRVSLQRSAHRTSADRRRAPSTWAVGSVRRARAGRATVAVAGLLASVARPAATQRPTHGARALGTVDFRISCSPQAQVTFNRAVALLHHMSYPQAREAFEQVAATDSSCAMAYWGVAMTLFQPLWPTRPGPEALRQGWQAVRKAESLRPPTERERSFVAATAAFFRDPDSTDYWQRVRRWEAAMERTFDAFPQDDEATAFYALAHLAVAPATRAEAANAQRAARLLLGLYARNPDHPGAMHYLVHANDTPSREHESPDIVARYQDLAPENAHALHMPTHIYTRLGDWAAVIGGNLRAAEAALRQPVGDRRQFVWDEFPHAIEYLVYAYLQAGADSEADAQVQRLRETPNLQPSFKTAFHLASTRARYALERHEWRDAMALTPRQPPGLDWGQFPWAEAVTWFARGLGAAHLDRVDDARAAHDHLAELEQVANAAGEQLFARNIRILRLGVSAWLAHARHDPDSSVRLMREAAELEVSTPKHAVTPGPTLPGYELLGDLLLAQERPADALAAYRRSLELYPRRFNGLLGAARAARAAGDSAAARTLYRELLDVASPTARRPALDEARGFVSARAPSSPPRPGRGP